MESVTGGSPLDAIRWQNEEYKKAPIWELF